MGLAEIKAKTRRLVSDFGLNRRSAWVMAGLTTGLIALAMAGEPLTYQLRFERAGIEAGELWRLASGHLVHLGWRHLWLNVTGLLLIGVLFGQAFTAAAWLLILAGAVVLMDLGFWQSGLEWYVGLSGLLHAGFAAGTLRWISAGLKDGIILGVILVGKLAWEQIVGPMPFSETSAGGPVVVDAHLYGALGGGVVAGFLLGYERWRGRV